MKYVPFPLGPMKVLGNLLSSLVLWKFGPTSLFVFLVPFWTEALYLTHTWRNYLHRHHPVFIIRATAHTSWGWHRSTLKMAFHALIHNKVNYAAPAWQPWLSATNFSCLDRLQNRSFSSTHHWPACIFTIRGLTFGSQHSELLHMQQQFNLKS